jgi:hypothetical protein
LGINQLLCAVKADRPQQEKTMTSNIQLLDLPDKGLLRGQVGTVVEILGPGVFEVEFSDDQGHTYAQLALRDSQLLVLHYQPQRAA